MTPLAIASVQIHYWGILARASGLFRMLEEAGIPYSRVTDRNQMSCALFGDDDPFDTANSLAPPVLVITNSDGTSLKLSQAVACHSYFGKRLGYHKGIATAYNQSDNADMMPEEFALQYMMDLSDLHSEMADAANKGRANNDVIALQAYVTSDRYKRHLQAINRCIKGPFYFGKDKTYVDFATTSYLDMCEGKWLTPLLVKTGGDTIQRYAPKLRAVVTEIRNLPSAKKLDGIPRVPKTLVLSDERVATWKDQEKDESTNGKKRAKTEP